MGMASLGVPHAYFSQKGIEQQVNLMEQSQDSNIFLIGLILFLYDKESLVSSNLNSKLLRFHCVRP
jgi:hypothetical protein